MKKVKFLLVAIFCVSMMMLAMNASATIYMNEDFESADTYVGKVPIDATNPDSPTTFAIVTNFVNRNNKDLATSETVFGTTTMTMGTNIKAERLGTPADPDATTMSMTKNQGSRTTETFFSGAYSTKLFGDHAGANTSNTLSMLGRYGNMVSGGWQQQAVFRIWQFAIRTDTDSTNMAAGTRIGHFKIAYSTDGTTAVAPNAAMALSFFVNSKKTVDIICTTTLKGSDRIKVGEFGGNGPRSWSVITIVENQSTDPQRWICFDKDHNYIGPKPLVLAPSTTVTDNLVNSEWYMMPTGYNVFVNRDQQSAVLGRSALSTKWGTVNAQASPVDFGWELQAENDGHIFVDQMLWVSTRQQEVNAVTVEIGNRMLPFNKLPEVGNNAAAGPSWMLY